MCFSLRKTRRFEFPVYFELTILLAIFLSHTSCATHTKLRTTNPLRIEASGKTLNNSYSQRVEKRIRDEYVHWEGTRHRMGGTGRTGADCSGFVKTVYKRLFDIALPRTTKEQVREGAPVKQHELQAGDLVFFKPPSYPRHVGIYLSKNEFVHASKSKGVIISQLDPHYWSRYYWTARRILPKH